MDNIFGACDKITLFGLWTLLAGRMPSTLWYEQDPHELWWHLDTRLNVFLRACMLDLGTLYHMEAL